MAGSGYRPPGSGDPGWRLRALAAVINDALTAMGTSPAFALSGPATVEDPGLLMPMAIEVAASPSRSGHGRRGSYGVGSSGRRGSSAPPEESPVVDEQHLESWRLVRLAQQGEGEAFGQLYDRYVDVVYRFIYYRVNDRGLAEDFTSETFLRALRRITTISYQGRDIGAWFVTIARNIVLDHMKSARHRLEITTGDTIEGDEREPSPESAVLESLASAHLMAAIDQLGDEQRECVMLRFIQGFSVSETAAVMGKNDGAIKALQHRAVRKLAVLVGGDLR
ncbi:MAG: sigma-70 family RNA polymerase sigma factor [Actinomycetota bacterium]|nr:sigma-70 family RNA polymerase sigma factor [Actinomycetota bacterium]